MWSLVDQQDETKKSPGTGIRTYFLARPGCRQSWPSILATVWHLGVLCRITVASTVGSRHQTCKCLDEYHNTKGHSSTEWRIDTREFKKYSLSKKRHQDAHHNIHTIFWVQEHVVAIQRVEYNNRKIESDMQPKHEQLEGETASIKSETRGHQPTHDVFVRGAYYNYNVSLTHACVMVSNTSYANKTMRVIWNYQDQEILYYR